jgi:hypothetical protein
LPALQLPAVRKSIPVTGKNPDQAGSVRAWSKTRGRCCVLRAGALDFAQLEDASTTAEPGITGETVKGSCARMADRALKILSAAHRETRKARKDAMPHERGSSPVPPIEFSSIVLADRKIRFRRESPAARPPSTAAPPDPGKTADSKELDSKHPPLSIAALIRGCLRDHHAPHFTPSGRSAY